MAIAGGAEVFRIYGTVDIRLSSALQGLMELLRRARTVGVGVGGVFRDLNIQVTQTTNNITQNVNRVTQAGTNMGNTLKRAIQGLAFGAAANQISGVTKAVIGLTSQMEALRTRLRNASDTQAEANKIFRAVEQFDLKTPFELPELIDAAIKFKGLGLSADETMAKLKEAGELAAFFGKDLTTAAQAIARILGGSAEGVEVLRNEFNLSVSEFRKLGGPVDATGQVILRTERDIQRATEALSRYIQQTTKGVAAESLADKLSGRWSSLQGEIARTADSVGESLIPALLQLSDVATGALKWIQNLPDWLKTAVAFFGLFVTGATAVLTALSPIVIAGTALIGMFGGLEAVIASVTGAFAAVAASEGALGLIFSLLGSTLAELSAIGIPPLLGLLTGTLLVSAGNVLLGILSTILSIPTAIVAIAGTIIVMTGNLEASTRAQNALLVEAEKTNAAFKAGLEDVSKTADELLRAGKNSKDLAQEMEAVLNQMAIARGLDKSKGQGGFFETLGRTIQHPISAFTGDTTDLEASDTRQDNALYQRYRKLRQLFNEIQSKEGKTASGLTITEINDQISAIEQKVKVEQKSASVAAQELANLRMLTAGVEGFGKVNQELDTKIFQFRKQAHQERLDQIGREKAALEASGQATADKRLALLQREMAMTDRTTKEGLKHYAELENEKLRIYEAKWQERRDTLARFQAEEEARGTFTPQRRLDYIDAEIQNINENTIEGKKRIQELKTERIRVSREITEAQRDASVEILRISGQEFAARRIELEKSVEDWRRAGLTQTQIHALESQKRRQIDKEEANFRIQFLEEMNQARLRNRGGRLDTQRQELEFQQGRGANVSGALRANARSSAAVAIQEVQSRLRSRLSELEATQDPNRAARAVQARRDAAEEIYKIEQGLRSRLRDLEIEDQNRAFQESQRRLEFQTRRTQYQLDRAKDRLSRGGNGAGQDFADAIAKQADLEVQIAREKAKQESLTATQADKTTIQRQLEMDILSIREKARDALKDQLQAMKDQNAEAGKLRGLGFGGVTDAQGNEIKSFDPLAEAQKKDEEAKARRKAEADRKAAAALKKEQDRQARAAEEAARRAKIDPKTGQDTGRKEGAPATRAQIAAIDRELAGIDTSTREGAERAAALRKQREDLLNPAAPPGSGPSSSTIPAAPPGADSGSRPGGPKAGAGAAAAEKASVMGEMLVTVKIDWDGGTATDTQQVPMRQRRASPMNPDAPPGQRGRV